MQETYNAWSLVSLSPLPFAWRVIACLAVVAAVTVLVLSYRGSSRRVWLITTRLLMALCVLGVLVEPAIQLRAVRKIKNRLAVIVDRSASMTLPSASGTSRYDQLLGLVNRSASQLKALGEQHTLEWYDLSGPLSDAQLATPPRGERSDLLRGIEAAVGRGNGRPLSGMVLFSDGADNAGLEGEPGKLGKAASERLEAIGVPINTVNVAAGGAFVDIAIVDVVADEFAFVHNTISIEVQVEVTGIAGTTVPLTLKREGDILANQEVVLTPGKPQIATFKTKPDKIGEFVYSVSVPVIAGESVTANNERSFVLQVIRDKIRVLQVAGRPSWDERFLRQHLKENPNVDLISFFILRTPTDIPMADESEMSLIPFPVERLFTSELSSFDVVIFQNFDYRPYQMERYLPNIAAAVKNGLGFVMIGGEQSFGNGGYARTPIEGIVPVRLDTQATIVHERAQAALTEAGRRHPITDLGRGGASNERIWSALPPWLSINRVSGIVQSATTLVTTEGTKNGPQPVVAVMEVGEGRSMAIATDAMWRWRLSSFRDGGASQRAFHRFWSNALRWLVRDPEHSRVQVLPEKRRFEVGDDVSVSFTVRESDYQPVPYGDLDVTVENDHGQAQAERLLTNEQGAARFTFKSLPGGAYRIRAKATQQGRDLGSGQAVFVIESRSLELTRAAPRPDLLKAMADATSGNALDISANVFGQLATIDPEVVEVDRRRNIELWDNAWALVALVAIFAADWALRRRSGYL
ncbi:MAG: glutamine amidotransferase [Myxococcota bacterium]